MVIRSRFSAISARAGGSGGRMPVARSTASGNFAGCAVASATIGVAPGRCGDLAPGRGDRHGGMRVDQQAASADRCSAISSRVISSSTRWPENRSRAPRQAWLVGAAGCRSSRNCRRSAATAAAVAAFQLEQQALEIAGDLDVHARAEARQRPARSSSRRSSDSGRGCRWRWCRSTSRSIGRPMRARQVAGIDVAEIAGRHAERRPPAPARRAPAPAAT